MTIDYKYRYLLNDWQKEAVELLNDKFREQLRATDDVLMDFADKAESGRIQNHLFDAQREIWLKMEDMSLDFHDLLTKSLSQFPPQEKIQENALGEETLSLVNVDLYERNLALHTLAERAEKANYQELYLLAQRLSVLNGGQPVKLEQIPASPQQMCELFARCVNRLTIENDALLVLYTLYDKYVLSALPGLYEKLNQSLIKAGILPTLKFKVKTNPDGTPVKAPEEKPEENTNAGVSQTPEELGAETLSRIHELLKANRARRGPKKPLPPGVSPATPQEVVEAVTSVTLAQSTEFPDPQELDQAVPTEQLVQVQKDLVSQRQTIKQKIGSNRLQEEQEDIIDLVGMLFEQMLDDPTIPNTTKALLGHLHTPYIKIGLSDRGFFADTTHPARQFLDRAITASAIWVDEANLKEGIYPFLKDIVFRIVRLREQSKENFEEFIQLLGKETDQLEQKFSVLEKHNLEAEQGKEHLLRAKQIAKSATAEIFSGQSIPAHTMKFVEEVWVDYLTLLQLREGSDTESPAWQEAISLGRRILATSLSTTKGDARTAQIDRLAKQLWAHVGGMLPHQGRKIESFIQLLHTPPAEQEEAMEFPSEPVSQAKEIDARTLKLYNTLRALPADTWFELDAKSKNRRRAKLSWYNQLSDHFLFVNIHGKKSALLDIAELAQGIADGSIVYFTEIRTSFWSRAMNAIKTLLEKEETTATPERA